MSVLIDSSGWIEYFTDGSKAEKYKVYVESSEPETHITSSIVIYEVYKKLKKFSGEETALKAIAHILSCTTLVKIDDTLALNSAETSIKHGLAMADSIIKSTADVFGAKVVTSDTDLKGIENVIFI